MEIDVEENYFYRIFPDIPGFESAQIYEVSPDRYIARIVTVEYSRRKVIRKQFDFRGFFNLHIYIDHQPVMTETDRKNAGLDLAFLHADKILSEIDIGTHITIRRRGGLWTSGELLSYEVHNLHLKTFFSDRTISIYEIKKVSFREKTVERSSWKPTVFGITAALGLSAAEAWNRTQEPRAETVWFYRSIGTVSGLLIAPKIYRKINVILTPKRSYKLSVIKN